MKIYTATVTTFNGKSFKKFDAAHHPSFEETVDRCIDLQKSRNLFFGALLRFNNENFMSTERDSLQKSPWQEIDQPIGATTPANHQAVYDVMIVGAGLTGITTALLLQSAGKQCLLLDGHTVGYGTTGGTTAHINTFFDATYPEIESDFNEDAAKLVALAGKEAIDLIKTFVQDYQINCDLEEKTGYLYAEDEEQTEQLADILKSASSAGVRVAEADHNGLPIPFRRSLQFESQYQFHPLKYIRGLLDEYLRLGGMLMENTFVSDTQTKDNTHFVHTTNGSYQGLNLVWATHIPPGINKFSVRCAPYRSYVLGLKLKDKNAYPTAMAYDMQEPYHYFRTHELDGQPILIVGGEDHKTGHDDPEQAYQLLEAFCEKYFSIDEIAYRWSSQYYTPVDGLPYIGRMSSSTDCIFVATGFNGNGMTWGTISAQVITDEILERENKYIALFKPYRMKPIAGFTEFVKENADVAYHFISDRFHIEDIERLSELEKGEGKVVEYNGEKVALYKDQQGLITALHPTCTHAGCTVKFNQAEQSWDCPCHGGRFDVEGKVISGPPRKDLPPVDISTSFR